MICRVTKRSRDDDRVNELPGDSLSSVPIESMSRRLIIFRAEAPQPVRRDDSSGRQTRIDLNSLEDTSDVIDTQRHSRICWMMESS